MSGRFVLSGSPIFYDDAQNVYYVMTPKGRINLLKVNDSPLTLMVPGQIEYVEIKGEIKL